MDGSFPTDRKTQRKDSSVPINISLLKEPQNTMRNALRYIKQYIRKISSVYGVYINQRRMKILYVRLLVLLVSISGSKRKTKELHKVFLTCTCSAKHREEYDSDNEVSISKCALLEEYSEGDVTLVKSIAAMWLNKNNRSCSSYDIFRICFSFTAEWDYTDLSTFK